MKRTQIDLESFIINKMNMNNYRNNTIHFVWDKSHSFNSKITLFIVTNNRYTDTKFLFKRVYGFNEKHCLQQIVDYLNMNFPDENNYSITWKDSNDVQQISYFTGIDEDEVKFKFNYLSGDKSSAKIVSIKQTPLA